MEADATMPSPSPKPAHQSSSILQRTVTTLHRMTPVSLLEALTDDDKFGQPETLEGQLGRTLKDLLCTPPHLRTAEDVAEIEHAPTKWSRCGTDLPKPSRLELCKYMGFAEFVPGEVIFKQGDSGDHFYIILSGAVDVAVDEGKQSEKVVAHLLAGAAFGELAPMQGHGKRRATCRCTQPSELFTVNIKDFKRILSPLQQGTLQAKMAFLKQVPEFQDLPANTIESMALVLTERVVPPKGVIYYQGSEVEDFLCAAGPHQAPDVQLVRELNLDRKTLQLSKQASSIPAWLQSPRAASIGRSAAAASKRRSLPRRSSSHQPSKVSSAGTRDKVSSTSYHKLSLEVINRLSGPGPSRPSSWSAAEGSRTPTSAKSAKGQAAPSQPPTRQPLPAVAKGRVSPSQPSEEQLAADAAEHQPSQSWSTEGKPVAAVTKGGVRPSVISSQGSQSLLGQSMGSANGQRKGPGLLKPPQGSSARFSGTAPAADSAQPKASTMNKRAAGAVPCSPGHIRVPGNVKLSGKSAAVSQTRTADLSAAVNTTSAAVKDHATATSSAAASKTASASVIGIAAVEAHDDAQPAQLTPRKRQTTFKFKDVKEELMESGPTQAGVLHSKDSLMHNIMQQMSYTGSYVDQSHLFLEVDSVREHEFFGDASISKTPTAPASAVAADVTATVLVMSKWDLLKRAPKELTDHIIARAQNSIIDDENIRKQYRECKAWQRFKQSMVEEVLEQRRAARSKNPAQVWKGSFRDEAPIDRNHKAWRPNGIATLYRI